MKQAETVSNNSGSCMSRIHLNISGISNLFNEISLCFDPECPLPFTLPLSEQYLIIIS